MDIHHNDHEPDNNEVSGSLVSRRRLLAIGGLGVGAALGGASWAGAATSPGRAAGGVAVSPATVANACRLTTEQIEGPYYLDYELIRRNVTEDRTGVPLALNLRVVDAITCRALRGAAVEIWHCDALGVYSGYTSLGNGGGVPGPVPTATPTATPTAPPTGGPGGPGGHVEPTDDLTFLRGMQVTNRLGFASFRTIVPGWYAGRALHIHTKVHVGGRATPSGYEGGHECHTGQLYVDEQAAVAVSGLDPYRTNTVTRILLDDDFIYPGTGAPGGLLSLRYNPKAVARGMTGSITMAVNPTLDTEA